MSRRTELPSAEQPTAAGYNALTSSAAARADSLITAMKDTCPNPASQDGYLALCRALFLRDALKTQLTQTQPDDVASAARAYACAAHTVKVIADHATTLVSSLSFEDSLASAAIPPGWLSLTASCLWPRTLLLTAQATTAPPATKAPATRSARR